MRWSEKRAISFIRQIGVELQHHKCPISGHKIILEDGEYKSIRWNNTTKTCALDHDHSTGYMRGVLCEYANMLLGPAEKGYYGILSPVIHNSSIVQTYYDNASLESFKILHKSVYKKRNGSTTGYSNYLKQKFEELGWNL